MERIDDPHEEMMIPEELIATDAAMRAVADAIVPGQAFLDALDARVRREAAIGGAQTPLIATGTAVSTLPFRSPHEVADRDGVIPRRVSGYAAGMTADRPARAIGRRRFLIGSVAATAAAAFAALQRRPHTAPNLPATQQARGVLITGQMVAAAPPVTTAGANGQPSNLDFADGLVGWGLWGSNPEDYADDVDPNVKQHGSGSGYLRASVPDPAGFGTLMRSFVPESYRGTRVRMTGTVKADAVEAWAGLWMRVDGPQSQTLSFDNMQGRPITGTRDWQTYAIVLDVPQESTWLSFGILLVGKGSVWLNDVSFEIVGQDVPTSDIAGLPSRMQNLDFEMGATGWFLAGDQPRDYRIGADTTISHDGNASAYLRSNGETPGGFGTLMQMVQAGSLVGTRVRMSGWVKASGVEDEAGLWMRVDGADAGRTQRSLSFDNMQNRPIKGTSDWTRYEIVLDVPQNAAAIAFGIRLRGKGQVWLDDVQFMVVGPDVPTTNIPT